MSFFISRELPEKSITPISEVLEYPSTELNYWTIVFHEEYEELHNVKNVIHLTEKKAYLTNNAWLIN